MLMSQNSGVPVGIAAGGAVLVITVCSLWRRQRQLTRTKGSSSIFLIRHGESTVNARGWQLRQQEDPWPGRAYHEPDFFDACLTEEGRDGAATGVRMALQSRIGDTDGPVRRLVITSTLQRALETASCGVLPVLPPNRHTEWIALDCVREATTSEIRSANGVDVPTDISEEKPCNLRRTLSHARKAFPHVDFVNCEEEDPLPRAETIEMVDKRVSEFVIWLREWVERQSKDYGNVQMTVVLVSHYVFLHRLMSKLESQTGASTGSHGFKNCEVRELPLSSILSLS